MDSVQVGTAALNAQGVATLQYTFPTQDIHTIQAFYTGLINADASVGTLTKGFAVGNAPTIAPSSGTYHYLPSITMSDRVSGAVIHYTLDGTAPNAASPIYSAPFQLTKSATIQAIAVSSLYANSAVTAATYTIVLPAATPTFSAPAGKYPSGKAVSLADTTAGAMLYYTLDGSTPTTSSAVYSAPIVLSTSKTIKAIAAASGYLNSSVASAAYTIQ